jgi:hypothetical protein
VAGRKEENMTAIAKTKPGDLVSMSTEDLRRELARQMELTADHLTRLAQIVKTLEDRGEDLSDLKIGMLHHLRRIASGQVLAEVVVRFAEYPLLLARIGVLPLADQQRIISEPLRLTVVSADGTMGHRLVDPLKLTREQVGQIFAKDHIRDEQEQILILESQKQKSALTAKPKTANFGKIRVNYRDKTVMVGRYTIDVPNLLSALAEIREEEPGTEEETKTVPVQLTETQHRRLRMRSAESGRPMGEIIRDALRAYGLI